MPVDVSFDRLRDAARERWGHLTVISVDTVFLEYVHVMISNGKSPRKLQEDLSVFLEDDTDAFCEWLTDALATTALAGSPPAPAAATKQEARRPSGSSQSEPAPQSEIHRETRRRPANEQTARASTRLVASAVSEAVESSTQSSNSRAAVTRKGRDLKSRIGPVKRTHQDLKDSHDGGDHSTGALPSSVPARLRGRLGEVPQQRMDERTEEYEYEQEEEEGEEEEVGYDEGSRKRAKTTGQQQRCSFWPACTKQDCPFVHPTQVCKLFPKCPYGDRKCLFVHPAVPCRFGVLCTNPNCRFAHPPKQKHRPSVRAAPPTSKPTPQFQLCRFGPACTRPACPFQHLQKATAPTAETPDTPTSATSSVLCRFHPHCSRRPACPFLHPTSSSRHKSLLLVNNRPHAITDKPPQQLIPAESEPQNVDKSAAFIPLSE